MNSSPTTQIQGEKWYQHFSNLHSAQPTEGVCSPSADYANGDESLNKSFTKDEFLKAINKLKPGKASGFDKISNEMLKNSPPNLLDLLLQYILTCA